MGVGDEDGVDGEGAVGADEEGVEVEAFDGVGVGGGEEGEAEEGGREGVEVGGGLAAEAGEDGEGRDFLDHGPRLGLVEGSGAESHVLEGFDEDAAESEHDDRAEHGVALNTEDGLDAPRHHGGDEAAIDRRVGLRGAGGGEDLVKCRFGGGPVGDAEADAELLSNLVYGGLVMRPLYCPR